MFHVQAGPQLGNQQMKLSALSSTLAAGLFLCACADPVSTPAPATPAPNFIVGGTPTGSAFGNVGTVMYDFAGDGLDADDWFCTGSLISPTVFLTAAHCLEFLPPRSKIYVSFDPSTSDTPLHAIAATEYAWDPQYGKSGSEPHDIGVVLLPAKSTKGIAPLNLPPLGYLDDLAAHNGLKDRMFLNVGYGGDASRTGTPAFTYDGVRKVSRSPFQSLQGSWLVLSMNVRSTGEGGDCYGDSGGPKFIEGDNSTIVALVVTGDIPCRSTTKDYRLDIPEARSFLAPYVALP
jgi:hypothetical protein